MNRIETRSDQYEQDAQMRHMVRLPVHGGVPPKLIIFNGFLVGAGAQHCQGQIRQRDRFATTMTIPTRNGDFGVTRAGSEWPARRAHSSELFEGVMLPNTPNTSSASRGTR